MTIDSVYQAESFSVDPSGTYDFSFEHLGETQLSVYEQDFSGSYTKLPSTSYVVDRLVGAGPVYVGGRITISATPSPDTVAIEVRRNTTVTQLTDYDPYRPFPAEANEYALDKITLILQEHGSELDYLFGQYPGSGDGAFVSKVGDTMTGNLVMLGDSEIRIESSNNPGVFGRLYAFTFGNNVTLLDGNAAISNSALRAWGAGFPDSDNYDLVAASDGFLYWRGNAIADQNGVIGGGGGGDLPDGTVTNQSLRWDGASWVASSELLIDPNGGNVIAANDITGTRVIATGSVIGDLLASEALATSTDNIVGVGAVGIMADTGIAWADIIPNDAPADGGVYARQNNAWVISGGGGGLDPADDILWSGKQTYKGSIVVESATVDTSFVTLTTNEVLGLIVDPEPGLGFSIQSKNLGGTSFALAGATNGELKWNGNLIADINGPVENGVASFNGRTGAVTPQSGDYSAFYAVLSGTQTFSGVNRFGASNTRFDKEVRIHNQSVASEYYTIESLDLIGAQTLYMTPSVNGSGFSIQAKSTGGVTYPLAGGPTGQLNWAGVAIADVNGAILPDITESDVPNLPASKITSGTFANARISASSVTQHLGGYAQEADIAFGQVTGSNGAIKAGSRGVSSVTRTGTGNYQINFSSAAASTTAQSMNVTAVGIFAVNAACNPVSATQWTVTVFNSAGTAADFDFTFQRIK